MWEARRLLQQYPIPFFQGNGILVFPFYTMSLEGNIYIHKPCRFTNRKKYSNYNNYKGNNPNPAKKHLSIQCFIQRPHLFHLPTEKGWT